MTARHRGWSLFFVLVLCVSHAWAQDAPVKPAPDPLGRDTPRGSVLGFIAAARDGKYDVASQYLNPAPKTGPIDELAKQLYTVLNRRLPARLATLSDRPDGSLSNPLVPDEEVVGVVPTSLGDQSIVLERVKARNGARIWLFARTTLAWVPDVYNEIDLVAVDRYVPPALRHRLAGVRLFEWVALLVLIPLLFRLLAAVDWLVALVFSRTSYRRLVPGQFVATWVPRPLRLIVLAVAIKLLVPMFELPLLERRLWAVVVALFTIIGCVGLLLRAVDRGERYLQNRVRVGNFTESRALLRLLRRVIQGVLVAAGGVVALQYFGFDPTAALAGLGIGGIAVALAAQKTLENVIGGFSLVFDKAVRVGDFLKVGETVGTIDHVGLRSTRIRTLDRTVVSVPNGQMATVNIETLSLRDKFWFHHIVGLRYDTTAAQMRDVSTRLEKLLLAQPGVDKASVRVRFIRLGAYSLDLELFAYIFAPDWEPFLEVQQELLIRVMEIIESAGTGIAFPSQTVHLAGGRVPS